MRLSHPSRAEATALVRSPDHERKRGVLGKGSR
jgi:hypothetical protein